MAERWDRAQRLVADALGPVPDELVNAYRMLCGLGSHDLSAMRELLGRPRGVAAARQWRDGGFITALLEYDDYVRHLRDRCRRAGPLRRPHRGVRASSSMMRVQYDTPYVRHFPTVLITEETSGDALHRTVSRPHLKDPYTHELEYFHHVVTEKQIPKTSPEDYVEDLDLFAEIIRALDRVALSEWLKPPFGVGVGEVVAADAWPESGSYCAGIGHRPRAGAGNCAVVGHG